MPSITEFRTNPHKFQHLADILADPVMAEAIEIVLRVATPRVGAGATAEALGIQQAYGAGIVRSIESLKTLATKAPEQSEDDELPPPFSGYIGTLLTPEQIEAKIAKRRNRKQNQQP